MNDFFVKHIGTCILLALTFLAFWFGKAFAGSEVMDGFKDQSQIESYPPVIVPLSGGKMQYKLAKVTAPAAASISAPTPASAPAVPAADGIPDVMNSSVGPSWSSPGFVSTWRYDRAKRQFETYGTDGRKAEVLKVIQFDQQRVVLQGRLLIGPTGGSQTQSYEGVRRGNRIVGKSKGNWLIFSGVSDWEAWW